MYVKIERKTDRKTSEKAYIFVTKLNGKEVFRTFLIPFVSHQRFMDFFFCTFLNNSLNFPNLHMSMLDGAFSGGEGKAIRFTYNGKLLQS